MHKPGCSIPTLEDAYLSILLRVIPHDNAAYSGASIARADFLERVRRFSFLVMLLCSLYLGYAVGTGEMAMRLEGARGVCTSAWVGTTVALITGCFISLAGFYVIKNAVERDRVTGVGQILAATPLTKLEYATGKWLNNTAVLMVQVGLLAVAAIAMFLMVAEEPHLSWWKLLSPFLLLAAPVMALTAAFAVLFEMTPGLRGGFGNILWFFVWTGLLAGPFVTDAQSDPLGIMIVLASLRRAVGGGPDFPHGFSLGGELGPMKVNTSLRWQGIEWGLAAVGGRLGWIVAAFGLVIVAALLFDRFDRTELARIRVPKTKQRRGVAEAPAVTAPVPARVHLTPWTDRRVGFRLGSLVWAELRLSLAGYRWWWFAVAAGLVIGQLSAPLEISCGRCSGSVGSGRLCCGLPWEFGKRASALRR